jgi:hypothetical protein
LQKGFLAQPRDAVFSGFDVFAVGLDKASDCQSGERRASVFEIWHVQIADGMEFVAAKLVEAFKKGALCGRQSGHLDVSLLLSRREKRAQRKMCGLSRISL